MPEIIFFEEKRIDANVSDLVGETLTKVIGLEKGSEKVFFHCESGKVFKMYHSIECCESVYLEDIAGDIDDLVNGKSINLSEEVSNIDFPKPSFLKANDDYTWTFYRIQAGGCVVTLRWLGHSNGYYSERASFCRVR